MHNLITTCHKNMIRYNTIWAAESGGSGGSTPTPPILTCRSARGELSRGPTYIANFELLGYTMQSLLV